MLSFLAVLIAGTGYIILGEGDTADTDAPPEYVVVLGAQIHGSRPSRTLRERLDKAAGYLEEHPEAFCVVTGGQGADETQTEASVMAAYLTAQLASSRSVNLLARSRASTSTAVPLRKMCCSGAGKRRSRPIRPFWRYAVAALKVD